MSIRIKGVEVASLRSTRSPQEFLDRWVLVCEGALLPGLFRLLHKLTYLQPDLYYDMSLCRVKREGESTVEYLREVHHKILCGTLTADDNAYVVNNDDHNQFGSFNYLQNTLARIYTESETHDWRAGGRPSPFTSMDVSAQLAKRSKKKYYRHTLEKRQAMYENLFPKKTIGFYTRRVADAIQLYTHSWTGIPYNISTMMLGNEGHSVVLTPNEHRLYTQLLIHQRKFLYPTQPQLHMSPEVARTEKHFLSEKIASILDPSQLRIESGKDLGYMLIVNDNESAMYQDNIGQEIFSGIFYHRENRTLTSPKRRVTVSLGEQQQHVFDILLEFAGQDISLQQFADMYETKYEIKLEAPQIPIIKLKDKKQDALRKLGVEITHVSRGVYRLDFIG